MTLPVARDDAAPAGQPDLTVEPDQGLDSDSAPDPVLPTFALMARFGQQAADEREAVRAVVERLTLAEEPFHEVEVERVEEGGLHLVVARFVLVSVDGETAVNGLHATLVAAGLEPDEVWLAAQVA